MELSLEVSENHTTLVLGVHKLRDNMLLSVCSEQSSDYTFVSDQISSSSGISSTPSLNQNW